MSNPRGNPPVISDKKREILSIAAKEFASNGYAAVSMRMLANKAKITPAALYYHYAGKEAIYYAVLKSVFTDKAAAVLEKVKGVDSPDAKLDKIIYWLVKLFSSDEVFKQLLQRELLDGDEARLKPLVQDVIEAPFSAIEKLLGQLVPGADTRLSATTAFALILGQMQLLPLLKGSALTVSPTLEGGEDSITAFAKYVKSVVLCGLNAKQETKAP